ncbi:MAG: hypothetical protein KGQ36_01160 [Rickettsiales bacterium]|nr:hypothetical protein [Rickettsiales bacterium]
MSTYANSVDVPRVFSFVFDSSIGKTTYINGYLAGQDSNNSRLSNISTLKIGKGYQGEIGEIIIFSRALRSSERHDVEKYLGKKWSVEVVTGASCEGTVGSGGCIEGDCSGSITGVTGTIEASDGSSDTATCNAAGYTGTASYSCSSTILNVTTPCGCALGYTSSGGACVQDCSVSVTGVSTTSVAVGNGTLTCDVDGYTGSVSYDCSSGGPASITGSCGLDACTGGTVTSSGGITIHKFTSSGTLICVIGRSAKVLVVAGGGGSGGVGHGFTSGGGGGGGVIYNPSYSIPNGGASVTVGAGGASGAQGGNSVFGSLTAIGGGRSVIYGTTASFAGGSGGGGVDTGGGGTGGAGTSGQGNNGGNYLNFDCGGGVYKRSLGGGGGAGAAGQNAQEGVGGDGGNGVAYDISGTMTYYGGGGGGASRNTTCSGTAGRGGSGGLGGGGAGGNLSRNGTSGTANTGGGGGMSSSGGSGVVIVSY